MVGVDEVGFGNLVLRAGEGFGKGAVVGENYQACSRSVETTGEVEFVRPGFVDQVDDGFVFPVRGGGEDACGFVEEDDSAGVCLEGFSGGRDVVELPDFGSAFCSDGGVEGDFPAI